jgi:hypothetical protein
MVLAINPPPLRRAFGLYREPLQDSKTVGSCPKSLGAATHSQLTLAYYLNIVSQNNIIINAFYGKNRRFHKKLPIFGLFLKERSGASFAKP